ncbi:MAG: hypothetical protein H0T09_01470 [Actinobacteria bacterium]|nr:hypothetical protein [Actinomycetota bacterium]
MSACPRLSAVFVVALLAGVCASAAAPAREPALRSGLTGVVMRGPITPVCQEGVPCEAPARVTLVFSRPGHQAARVRTRADAPTESGCCRAGTPCGRPSPLSSAGSSPPG